MITPPYVVLIILLVTLGTMFSAAAAGELVRMRRPVAGHAPDSPANPYNVTCIIHAVLFSGWVMASAWALGVPFALLLAASGLLIQVLPTRPAQRLAVRVGSGSFARLSLAAAAGLTIATAAAYGAATA